MNYSIEEKKVAPVRVLTTCEKIPFADLIPAVAQLYQAALEESNGSIIILIYQPELAENSMIRPCLPVKTTNAPVDFRKFKYDSLDKADMITTVHLGSYDNLTSTAQFLTEYTVTKQLDVITPIRFVLLQGQKQYSFVQQNPDDYITEIQVPIHVS